MEDLAVVRSLRRGEQRAATRALLLRVAVETLIERGVAGTSTLEVQQRAGVSRGALLHHFPTHAALLAATVAQLVRRNEANVHEAMRELAHVSDPLERAIRALVDAAAAPAYLAEIELWAVSRTDLRLRDALRDIERAARADRDHVLADLFSSVGDEVMRVLIIALSVEFARGLALSGILRADAEAREGLVRGWVDVATTMIRR